MVMFLTSAGGELDLGALIPSLDSVLGALDILTRALVLAGPLSLLGFGLFFFLKPPGEANYTAGYRFRYGMSKVEVWQWMQRLAGMVYGGLGLLLTLIMGIVVTTFSGIDAYEMVWRAVTCLIWEAVLVILATAAINITVMIRYDRKGNLRKGKE